MAGKSPSYFKSFAAAVHTTVLVQNWKTLIHEMYKYETLCEDDWGYLH